MFPDSFFPSGYFSTGFFVDYGGDSGTVTGLLYISISNVS